MNRKEYDMLFSLNAQLGSSYTGTFTKAQQQLVAMQKEINALSKSQADISAYQKQQAAVEASERKLKVLETQYNNIQQEMKETEGYSSELANKMLEKQLQIDKTTSSLTIQQQKLDQMGAALREAGVDTDNLGQSSEALGAKIAELKKEQEEAADEAQKFGSAGAQAFAAVQQAIVAAGIAKAFKEIYEFYAACADAAVDFESALTGVEKTTDLTEEELAAMSGALKDMATHIPATTEELAGIAEAAGQLGIAKDDLTDFTEIMAMLGTATNMTSTEAATMLAQFTSITGMNPALYSNLGATIVALGNNYATTERNIADMSQTIAAAGAISGMSEAQITAISAAVTSLGISAQNGGTQMTKLISDINSSVANGGEELTAYAAAAKMSGEDFAAAWGNDAAGALDMFIRGLNQTYESGQNVYGVLSDLDITETRMVTMVTSLAKSGDRLTSTLDTANAAWDANNALTTEAEKRYATTASMLLLAENAYDNLQIAIGDNYTPALKELYGVSADVLGGMAEFVEMNPELVKGVTASTGVIMAGVGGLTAYNAVVKIAIPLMKTFSLALPTGPIIAGTLAVAALAGVLVAVASAEETADEKARHLTASSREQYLAMRDLEREYAEVSSTMGATSAEAQLLKRELDDATTAFEENRMTAEDAAKAHAELMEAQRAIAQAHADSVSGIEREGQSVLSLTSKLEELMDTEGKTAATKQQILAVVDMLNQAIPELGLAYNEYADSLNKSTDALQAMARAEVARRKNAADYEYMLELMAEEAALGSEVNRTRADMEAAAKQAAEAEEKAAKARASATGANASTTLNYIHAAEDAREIAMETAAAYEEASAAAALNAQEIDRLSGELADYNQVAEESATVTEDITLTIGDATSKMAELSAAYGEAYKAAAESIVGQYDLWDKADKVVATSAASINKNLEGQAEYWRNYNANLAGLTERTGEIDGLREMLASFADGSSESVNAVAGMAKATDKELEKMVASWTALQEEQGLVAGSLAEIETDFEKSMAAIQTELTEAVTAMDLSDEAAQSGKSTLEGFISGSESMLPAVIAAYGRISQAANDAMLGYRPEVVGQNRYQYLDGSHADGLSYVPFDGYLAELHKGERVLTAEENQYVMLVPQLMAAMAATSASQAVSAEYGGGGNVINITLAPQYNTSGVESSQMEATYARNNDNLRELVLGIFEDEGIEAARRAYR